MVFKDLIWGNVINDRIVERALKSLLTMRNSESNSWSPIDISPLRVYKPAWHHSNQSGFIIMIGL